MKLTNENHINILLVKITMSCDSNHENHGRFWASPNTTENYGQRWKCHSPDAPWLHLWNMSFPYMEHLGSRTTFCCWLLGFLRCVAQWLSFRELRRTKPRDWFTEKKYRKPLYLLVKTMDSGEDFPLNQSTDNSNWWISVINVLLAIYIK